MLDEEPDFTQKYEYVDPQKKKKKNAFERCTIKELQDLIIIAERMGSDISHYENTDRLENYE